MARSPETPAPKKRIRLAPELRKQLILDAALVEFSAHGFGGTSTEKIAQRAGLSQAGLYTHYESKDDILEALLSEILIPQWGQWLQADQPVDEGTIDTWIDRSHALVADPQFLAVMRILIAEGARRPDLISQWRDTVMKPYLAEQQRIANALVARGEMQDNVLTEHFQLASSPILHVLLLYLVFGNEESSVRADIESIREAHRRMFKELVGVRSRPSPSSRERPARGTTIAGEVG